MQFSQGNSAGPQPVSAVKGEKVLPPTQMLLENSCVWFAGGASEWIPHPKTTGPPACLPKPLAGVPSGPTESDSDFHRKTPYWPLGLPPFPSPSG